MSDIVESWMWRPPDAEMMDRLLARAPRNNNREAVPVRPPAPAIRDRYYTQARRLHVKQLMRDKP